MKSTVRVKTQRLIELREDAGFKQFDAEHKAGITKARLSLFESGRANPNPEEVKRLAGLYGVPPHTLLEPEGLRYAIGMATIWTDLIGARLELNG